MCASKREQHNAYMRERINCKTCGGSYTRVNKQSHLKSLNHKKNTTDPEEYKLYIKEVKNKYNDRIAKISEERDKKLRKIDNKMEKLK